MTTSSPPPIRVLFVEDAFDEALLVLEYFRAAGGCEVVHSQDGDRAVELLRERDWDLLVTDLNLPGTDGFTVIREARRAHPSLPVLATTGYTAATYQEQAFRAGANELLTKPLDGEDFLARVAELVGRPRPRKPGGRVLAVGGLVGDAEMGCGGSLLAAHENGREPWIVPLWWDETDPDGVGLEGARAAAELLGSRLALDEGALGDTAARVALLGRIVEEERPELAYLPAPDDEHPARMEAFRIGVAATASVPLVLGYQTATTGAGFRPTRLVDVGPHMILKMEALAAYQAAGAGRVDLSPRMAQAYARYWGRLREFTEVEAFEVIREGE